MARGDTVQLRAIARCIIAEGRMRPGTVFWTDAKRAKVYIDQRVAEAVVPAAQPVTENKPVSGDGDKKPDGQTEAAPGNSSGADQDTRSTDSAKSSERGSAPEASSSGPGPASDLTSSKPSKGLKRLFGKS